MRDVSNENFGLLIAFVIPGFTVLWGVSFLSETVRSWMGASTADAPTVAGFLFATIASVTAGLLLSTVRWLLLDTLHHRTGLTKPAWDFSRFPEHHAAYAALTDLHYRYYQWYGSMLLALPVVFACWLAAESREPALILTTAAGLALVETLLFAGSRDTLTRYYERLSDLLGGRRPRGTARE